MPRKNKSTVGKRVIRAADAKEVGVGNPAEETYYSPNREKN
jgi:hypothetical protein